MAHAIPARLSSDYTASAGRKFGLTVGIAFAIFSAIAAWRGHPTTLAVLATLGGLLIVAALAVPAKLGPIDRAWMKLALLISKVTTPVFMGIVYFIVLTPVGILRRMFGANGLVHKAGPIGNWHDRSGSSRSSLDRLF